MWIFILELPVTDRPHTLESPLRGVRLPQSVPPMTILMVEDNALQRREIEAQLQPLGHRVISANNGQEALDRMEKELPDLIVMDAVMPSMDGFKACLLYTSPSPRDRTRSRMPSSA